MYVYNYVCIYTIRDKKLFLNIMKFECMTDVNIISGFFIKF